MELVSATTTQAGTLVVTLAEPRGLLRLEATRAEVAALCDAMEQAALLARASMRAAWLSDVAAGSACRSADVSRRADAQAPSLLQREHEGEQLDAWDRGPVALRGATEAEPLVHAVRDPHRGLARADDAGLAAPAALLDDVRHERGADAPPLAGRGHGEHPELRLAGHRDLAERAAVRDERDRAEQL